MLASILFFIALAIPQAPVVPTKESDRIEVVVPVEFQELLSTGPSSGRLKLFLNSTSSKTVAIPLMVHFSRIHSQFTALLFNRSKQDSPL